MKAILPLLLLAAVCGCAPVDPEGPPPSDGGASSGPDVVIDDAPFVVDDACAADQRLVLQYSYSAPFLKVVRLSAGGNALEEVAYSPTVDGQVPVSTGAFVDDGRLMLVTNHEMTARDLATLEPVQVRPGNDDVDVGGSASYGTASGMRLGTWLATFYDDVHFHHRNDERRDGDADHAVRYHLPAGPFTSGAQTLGFAAFDEGVMMLVDNGADTLPTVVPLLDGHEQSFTAPHRGLDFDDTQGTLLLGRDAGVSVAYAAERFVDFHDVDLGGGNVSAVAADQGWAFALQDHDGVNLHQLDLSTQPPQVRRRRATAEPGRMAPDAARLFCGRLVVLSSTGAASQLELYDANTLAALDVLAVEGAHLMQAAKDDLGTD